MNKEKAIDTLYNISLDTFIAPRRHSIDMKNNSRDDIARLALLAMVLEEGEMAPLIVEVLEGTDSLAAWPEENVYLFGLSMFLSDTVDEAIDLSLKLLFEFRNFPDQLLTNVLNLVSKRDKTIDISKYAPTAKKFTDKRGEHIKFFEAHSANAVGFGEIKEVFSTVNNKGTMRGLHRQVNPTQQKIIKVLNGSFNVRVVTPYGDDETAFTINTYDGITRDSHPIFVPEGSYLGYISLEDNSIMLYMGDGAFSAEADDAIFPLSEKLGIDWKYEGEIVISARDYNAKDI